MLNYTAVVVVVVVRQAERAVVGRREVAPERGNLSEQLVLREVPDCARRGATVAARRRVGVLGIGVIGVVGVKHVARVAAAATTAVRLGGGALIVSRGVAGLLDVPFDEPIKAHEALPPPRGDVRRAELDGHSPRARDAPQVVEIGPTPSRRLVGGGGGRGGGRRCAVQR